ncbi:SCO2400 family protein [Streptomyces akebiae]|uniref:Uncharacterized protein n=1 Tax=Streptomyces akebiae TaxID=2865673 RepID=A0ABX8XT23_9ACTN|nr:hypothetical protein [Streptomyces akebiae]QYX78693.1 hypothetical protein K1J60_21090 [Streptomyces akebiae]
MDYCSSCRRHLNGALVCPGCGAYAPDIAPATVDSRVDPSRPTGTTTAPLMIPMPPTTPSAPVLPAPTWEYGATDEGWHGGAPADGYATGGYAADGYAADEALGSAAPFARMSGLDGVDDVDGVDRVDGNRPTDLDGVRDVDDTEHVDVEGVPVAPRGRAARRRQLARWKKNQRRAVVATAVALVGGGLTVMSMDRQSTDRTQAATAPDAESLGSVEEQRSQGGRTPTTETDDVLRTPDASTPWTPSGDPARDRSTANRSNSRAEQPNSPRTDSATPSAQGARTGSSGAGRSAADDTGATPSDGTTTPPATDDSGSSSDAGTGSGTGAGTDNGSGNGSEAGSGSDTGSGSGSGSDTGASDGSSSDTATTSPSGLCLLGIVCVN